jgi:hypothetical protein
MSKHHLTRVLAVFSAVAVFAANAQEESGQATDSRAASGAPSAGKGAGTLSNTQPVAISFVLKPTAIAPEGASGSAELKGGELSFHLSHLEPGKYETVVVSRSGGVPYRAGVIEIIDPTSSPDRQANDNKKEASAHPESAHMVIDGEMVLPSELSSLQIDRVRVLGPGGNAVLEGVAK